MVICKYWKQGNCRNGNNCKFEHSYGNNDGNNGNNNGNSNSNRGNRGASGGVFGSLNRPERWHLNEEDITNDLTSTRPKWILSAYGPGKDTPAALFADNEYSPEEVRWLFYQAQAAGNADVADREAIQVWQKAESDMQNAATQVKDIQSFMERKEKEHPNRYDLCKWDGTIPMEEFVKKTEFNAQPGSSLNPWGGATRATSDSNPFSKPAFGQAASPFGQASQSSSPFGQPNTSSGFGQAAQPSAFGQPAQPTAFAKPAFGQASSPFGATSQSSGFGQPAQPSAFGKPAFGQTGFGQTGFNQAPAAFSQPQAQTSPFGAKPTESGSGFGQNSSLGQTQNPFAKPAASAFGAAPTAPSGFGQTAFGQPAAPAANASPFGQAASQTTTASPFGNAASATAPSGFGNAGASNTASPFGNLNAGSQTGAASPFGNTSATSATQSPFSNAGSSVSTFGQIGFGGQQQQPSTAFGQPAQPQQQPGFGQNPFGQKPQQAGFGQSPFGQPQQSQPQTGFGGPTFGTQPKAEETTSQSPFGQAASINGAHSSTNPFGKPQTGAQPSPFSSTNNPTSAQQGPFGTAPRAPTQPAQQAPNSQPTAQAQPSASKPTDKPVQPLHYSETLPNRPAQFQPNDKLSSYRGRPVAYEVKYRPTAAGEEGVDHEYPIYQRPDGKGNERIWFPKGAAESTVQRLANVLLDFQVEDDQYTEEARKEYARLYENGRFDAGKVPLVPPMRGWIDYDF